MDKKELIGTWIIESSILTIRGKKISTLNPEREMIKIFNTTHFGFFSRERKRDIFINNPPVDSEKIRAYSSFDAGGGRYEISGDEYIEHINFCTYPNYEGRSIKFKLKISGEKLIQEGVYPLKSLGLDSEDGYIVETYSKIS